MDDVRLVTYDANWPVLFDAEAARLRTVLSSEIIAGLEHFGSTAIAGMAAKPIIDILIAVPSIEAARQSFPAKLATLDYVFWAENPKEDRLFFVKGMPPYGAARTHHVHVTEPDGEMWQRLRFRDYLRSHPEDAAAYHRLKEQLAVMHADDREAYTDAKASFVAAIMRKAQ
jgi:GrpB-like predicted nucleotidyltransferase (UPF0157 family)